LKRGRKVKPITKQQFQANEESSTATETIKSSKKIYVRGLKPIASFKKNPKFTFPP
jgi:hypothetical protein